MTPTCEHCKHWDRFGIVPFGGEIGGRELDVSHYRYCVCEAFAHVAEQHRGLDGAIVNGIATGPQFGCRHFEPRRAA